MELTPEVLVVAPLAVFAAFFVFGMTGFGSSIVAVPMLAHVLPLTAAVPMMILLEFSGSLLLGRSSFRQVNRGEILGLMPIAVVGIVLGVTLLIKLPAQLLLGSLGVFALAFGIYSIADPHFRGQVSRGWALPTGLAGGTFSALYGTGGPIYASYLSRRIEDKTKLRSTMSAVITISTGVRIAIFLATGLLLQIKLLLMALALAPLMALGLKLGSRVHLNMSPHRMRQVLGAVLVGSGVSLLARALL